MASGFMQSDISRDRYNRMNAVYSPHTDKMPAYAVREHYSRALAYIILAATIAAGIYTDSLSHSLLWLVPYALLYPHFAYYLSRRYLAEQPKRTTQLLLFIDALHSGASIALLSFAVVPSMMAVLTISFSALAIAGLRAVGISVLLAGGSLLLTVLIIGLRIEPETPPLMDLVCLAFSTLYICVTAYFVHQQGIRLGQIRSEIKREQEKSATLARNLAKYLSPQVWESIFNGKKHVRLETQRKKLTVFFSDIKGFTELSEELEAEALTALLNTYLNEMSKICLKFGGTIDKFVGDSVMVFFGDPSSQGAKKDAVAAVSMAIAMRKHMKVLRQHWRAQGITKPLEIRMGLNSGFCTVGNFGADTRMDYTIIGRDVNLASRLESAAEAGEILISHETYSLIKDVIMCRDKGQISVKGFTRPVQIYQVVDFRRDLGASSSYMEHEMPGFSMYLDTNNIQNFDKERVIEALQEAAEKLRDKVIM